MFYCNIPNLGSAWASCACAWNFWQICRFGTELHKNVFGSLALPGLAGGAKCDKYVHFVQSFFVLGTTGKHSFEQWIERLWTSSSCWTAHEASAAELLGFLVLQEWQNERLAWEPESGHNFWYSRRFLGVSIMLWMDILWYNVVIVHCVSKKRRH